MHASSLPQRIGRYRILGELAVGGMAEILLARLEGPARFSRPVVIKRILPHLARQPEFVAMFLDEARIVAGISHPNVVHVHELSTEHDEFYLVMEYLEGESASGLMKRLTARDESLDMRLAIYIIAELAAGLHAAHELEDAAGARQGLVHRDVSPQNCIVTYDGHVKLLDFGVALAADRATRTEVGQIKGKLAYMSPEQCLDQPLDRRSDIFALGVVLYELTTGRLLFARENSAATVRAICDEPVLPPSRLVDNYPPELEEVCLRALSTLRDERYASCADMRAALFDVLRGLGDSSSDEASLGALMRELFADRIAEKRELLRKVETGLDVANVPAAEIDLSVELPTVAGAVRRSTRAVAPRSRRRLVALALAPILATAGVVAWRLGPTKPQAPMEVVPLSAPPIAQPAVAQPPIAQPPIAQPPLVEPTPPAPKPLRHPKPARVAPAQKPKVAPTPDEGFRRFE